MKKLIIAMVVGLSMSVACPLFAAEAEKPAAVSKADEAAVQKSVEALGQLFNVEKPKKAESPKAAAPSVEMTVARVMDKVVDRVSDVVGAMSQAISKIAPDVWRIMLRQQYAKAISQVIVPAVFGAIFLTIWFCLRELRKRTKMSDPEVTNLERDEDGKPNGDLTNYGGIAIVMWIVGIIFGLDMLWFGNRLADSSLLLINPEFYAIQDLLRMILNKGM